MVQNNQFRVRVTELAEPVVVLQPFLVSRVDLSSLATVSSKQQAASKQQQARAKWAKTTPPLWCLKLR